MSFLIVIPCLRESQRLRAFLMALAEQATAAGDVRVLVVDDGSGAAEVEKMQALVNEARAAFPCVEPLLPLSQNQGKGGAIYSGWDHALGSFSPVPSWLGFVDADGSVSASEVLRLVGLARAGGTGQGALFASRVMMLGRTVQRLWKRHLMGRVFATITSELLGIPVYDSQCGCKLVPREAYEALRSRLKVRGFAFDVELLVGLLTSGVKVSEVPVDWHEVDGGKVKLLRDSWRMLRDVLAIRQRWQ